MQIVESPVDSVLQALMSVSRVMRQRLPGDQIELGSFWLLKNLAMRGAMRVTDLASCATLDTSTVSRQVTQLERAGLIRRGPDPGDRRAQLVELSTQGSQLLEDGFRRRREILSRTLDHWESEDLAQLEQLLGRLVHDITTNNNDDHHEPEHA
jgi:DNA-binding MarR family transcriptional regulator